MDAWMQRAARALACAALLAASGTPLAQGTPGIAIADRDRAAHVAGERSGIEVVLDVGTWPPVPAPGGTIRIGDPGQPDADCVIALPAQPPLGCLWSVDTPGDYQLVATYSGDANHPPLASTPVAHTVLPPGEPERVSLPDPATPDRNTGAPSRIAVVSADGRWIAYVSAEPRLTDDARPVTFAQALLFDRRTGRTRRMSNAADGTPANARIERVAISGNGRFVAFLTVASNLVAGDPAGTRDWFLADRDGGGVQQLPALRIAPGDDLDRTIALSFDGRHVAFASPRGDLVAGDGNDTYDVFRLDRDDGSIALASRTPAGTAGAGVSLSPSISADGRLLAFSSSASDLIPGDTNLRSDIFVRDFAAGTTERASLDSDGRQATADAAQPALSMDGRFVAFIAFDGFVAGDDDGRLDVIVRDRIAGTTTWASPNPALVPLGDVDLASISADGSRVAFRDLLSDRLHLFDGATRTIGPVSGALPNVPSATSVQVSANGEVVVFDSGQPLMVAGDRNRVADVFTYEVATAAIARVSGIRLTGAASGATFGQPALSNDGAVVAFGSLAGNLVPGDANGGADIFVRDRLAATTRLASRTVGGGSGTAPVGIDAFGISGTGRYVVFASPASDLAANDTGGASDVFVHDRQDGSVRMVSRRPDGQASSGSFRPSISRDGRWIAFQSIDPFMATLPASGTNIYLHDTQSGTNTVVPPGGVGFPGAIATDPRLSGDGRFVVFASTSSTLVQGDTNGVGDVFLYDRVDNTTRRLSVSAGGEQGNGQSGLPEISADGLRVAFFSLASNLVPDDTNSRGDVFVVSLQSGSITRANVGPGGGQSAGDDLASRPALSADGRFVAFESRATDLVPGAGPTVDVYVRDLALGETRRAISRPPGNAGFGATSPAISADGRTIAVLGAGGLAAGGARHATDVFVAGNPIPDDLLFASGFEGP